MTQSKKRYKPFFKQFLRLRKNVQNNPKLFKFKKKKWVKFQEYSQKQLRFYRRYKLKDQYLLLASKFASRGNSFQKKFRNNLQERKRFTLFYGGLKRKYLKKYINQIKTKKSLKNCQTFRNDLIGYFESRLDTVLYRAKFCFSIKNARQLIRHGHISVNGEIVRSKNFILKTDDLIEIANNNKSRSLIKKNINRSNFWPIPPKNLIINYKTGQILFENEKNLNFSTTFDHHLNIDSLLDNINRF